jgi:predicted ATPase
MLKKILLISLLLPLLASCMSMEGNRRVVILQHPETMDFQNCEVDKLGLDKHFRNNEECVKDYQKRGYIVWGSR